MPKYEVAATCCQPINGPELLGIAIIEDLDQVKSWINARKDEWLDSRNICSSDIDYDPIEVNGNLEISAFGNETIFIAAWREV